MVVFTCNACGESLKKGQVEKHLAICRNCQCLSCIDCGKDFWGEDYKTHLKCLTEDEKYGGKAFEAKVSKGDLKQQQCIKRIKELVKKPDISENIRDILIQITTFDNVPRKKLKFQKWIQNSLKIRNPTVQSEVWEVLKEATENNDNTNNNVPKPSNAPVVESKSESSTATEETKKKSKQERKEERQKTNKKEKKDLKLDEQLQNGTKKKGKKRKIEDDESNKGGNDEANDEEVTSKKKKKKQREHEGEGVQKEAPQKKKTNDSKGKLQEEEADKKGANENAGEDGSQRGKFNWKGTIKALLRLAPDNELPIKKLRKKVIAQYYVVSSEQHKSPEELLAIFNKKIQNNPKFRVLKEKVKLVK
ncbi:cell growth-regulating nucleolar protein isoform X2 [Eleutherodactylus coqui]|uniref:cell growth-regulating nucleolar protein isoform X2 n=1 Tax=Eleutherodactylus coqui TaxID=57060 RepID=UPI0034618C24